jgi:serine/threonine protein kinase
MSKSVFFLYTRKALKEFTPMKIDATETEQLKSILNEIEILKKLSSKSEYVINYLDSFSTDVAKKYRIYHIVTDIYEVKYSNFVSG